MLYFLEKFKANQNLKKGLVWTHTFLSDLYFSQDSNKVKSWKGALSK